MCQHCGAPTPADHEQWVLDWYRDRRTIWQERGKDPDEATRRAMLDVEGLAIA